MRMRIAILCHSTLGGSARSAVRLATGLARRGHDVHLLTRGAVPWPIASGITHHRLEVDSTALDDPSSAHWRPNELRRFEKFVSAVIRNHAIELLHFHYAIPFASVAACVAKSKREYPLAIVATLHGTDVTRAASSSDRALLGRALSRVDAVTTVSRAYAAHAYVLLGLSSEPLVIPNFVCDGEHHTAVLSREQHAARLARPRIVHVSNFRAIKAPGSVARIFTLLRRHIKAELWLVGDGSELPRLRSALETLTRAGHVRFFGARSDVAALLPEADLVLLASHEESFGLSALEGMACGVPVVAPRLGGLPDVVTDGHAGLLFHAGDEEHAAACALALLTDPPRHWELRQGALSRALEFAEGLVLPRYEALYRRLLPESAVVERVAVGA